MFFNGMLVVVPDLIHRPRYVASLTVIASSSYAIVLNGMTLRMCRVAVYCIDTWSLPEILKALPLYPCVTRETVVERYRWFGGTVRDVLANAHVPGNTFRLKVEKVLSAKDLDHLCSLSFEGTSSDLKHRFAHYRVSAYASCTLCAPPTGMCVTSTQAYNNATAWCQ